MDRWLRRVSGEAGSSRFAHCPDVAAPVLSG
jgi:hypothetical protein